MSDSTLSKPPKLATRLLQTIYTEEIYDDIYGDMCELYTQRVDKFGSFTADLHYYKDVFLSIRNIDLRRKRRQYKSYNHLSMFKNYWKITLRNVAKNKVYSTLNIVGLAIGMAACFFILQYVAYEHSYDKFHENHENLYRIRYKVFHNGGLQIDCAAAVPRVGPFMKENMPEVIDYARAYPLSGVVSYEDIKFREDRIHIADPSFLKILSFPLIKGNFETALTEANTVVISETAARKFFGNQDPIGKVLKFGSDRKAEITGVAKDVPDNSHIKFDYLISFQTLNNETDNQSETSWGWYDYNSYVLLREGTNREDFDKRFQTYVNTELEERFAQYNMRQEFPLQPITDIHLYSNLLQESEPAEQGDGNAVFFLTIIAFFILIIAWINYINLSTARSIERAKEVGVRKVLGAVRKQLIYQFIFESVTLNLLAFVIALLIVVGLMPYFNGITGLALNLGFLGDSNFWGIALLLLGVGALISGLYPAFILSSFRPVTVLKGKMNGNSVGILLRKILVIFQFSASVALIAGTFIVYNQLRYMKNLDLGFDMTETLVVKAPGVFGADSLYQQTLSTFKSKMLSHPSISKVSSSSNVPGDEIFWTRGIKRVGEPDAARKTIYIVGVDHEYFPTYDIPVLAGRNFDRTFTYDTAHVLINKTAAKYLGFNSPEEAVNQKVDFWQGQRTIIGVVDDYNQMSAKNKVSPLIFRLVLDFSSYFTFKLEGGDYPTTFAGVESEYANFFPGNPFDFFFLDDFFNRQYAKDYRFSTVFTIFAGLAIVVACLGLFGLSSFSALQRTKEIGIRKSLGASLSSIVFLLSKEFIFLVLIANAIAWPVTYWVMDSWLSGFAYRTSIEWTTFIVSGVTVVIIAILTVGYKTIVTAQSNPVIALRYE